MTINLGNKLKSFLFLSFPIILGQIGAVLMSIADMIMLGKVGKNDIAAVGVANQVYFVFMVFGLGTMATLAPLISSSKGAEKNRECGELLRSGIELSFILSIFLCIILFIISENFYIFNQPDEINSIAKKYLRMINISTIPYLLFISLKQFSEGLHYTKPAMYITLGGILIKVSLNYIFIYGAFTLPAAGATGAGIATLLSRILMALSFVIYIFHSKNFMNFLPNLISTFKTKPIMLKIIKVGIPSGIQMFFEIAAFTGTAIMVGWLGTSYLAAHQILLGIVAFIYTGAVGFAVAGSIKVADAIGKKNENGLLFWSRFTFIIVLIFMIIVCSLLLFFNKSIINLFVHEPLVMEITSSAFLFMSIFMVIDVLQIISISMLRSLEDVKMPTYITLASYIFIGLPLSYFLGIHEELKINGIWIGLIVGGGISATILCTRYFTMIKKVHIYEYKGIDLSLN